MPPVSSVWQPLDIAAACTADIISTGDRRSADQFTFNGGRLASASWQRKNGYPEPGVPDDGRVQIPDTTPAEYFQVRMPPAKNAIFLSGPEGVQTRPVTIELATGERRCYSELAILHCTCWGNGTLRVDLRYETGAEASITMPVVDWGPKGRAVPMPAESRVAVNLHMIHPKFGAPVEIHSRTIPADSKRVLRSLVFSFKHDSITPPKPGWRIQDARRWFTVAVLAISGRAASTPVSAPQSIAATSNRPAKQIGASLAFMEDGQGNLAFNTSVVKGSLKKDGQGDFFRPITFIDPPVPMDNNKGLLVPYRFLTPQKRFGFGSWEWPRTGKILASGAAELTWAETPDRPFHFTATYSWKAVDTLDFTVAFTPSVDLDKFELFVGSYFKQFKKAAVYVKDAGDGRPGFVDTPKEKGGSQLFPRGEDVMPIIKDGRWKHPPYPNNWTFRQSFQAPLGIKSEPNSGVAVVIMAPPEDCFAVSMFEQNSGLGCYYLSLFGKDVKKGQTLIGHARMVFGKNITDEQALRKYQEYLQNLK